MTSLDRRGSPRIASQLPLAVADRDGELLTRTHNVSASGAYCTLKRFLPPMTKLHVRLEIPGSPRPLRLACQGVVVRVEPPTVRPRTRSYHVAIMFRDLTSHDRSTLDRYVQQQLVAASPRS